MADIKAILENGFDNVVSSLTDAAGNITAPQVAIATVSGAAIGGGVAIGIAAVKKKRKKTSKRKSKKRSSKSKKRSKKRKLKFGSKAYRKKYLGKKRKHRQKKPHTAGKRRDTSHRRIRYTKNNQPYVILPSGKARFIKKSSARASRKRKGGRY